MDRSLGSFKGWRVLSNHANLKIKQRRLSVPLGYGGHRLIKELSQFKLTCGSYHKCLHDDTPLTIT